MGVNFAGELDKFKDRAVAFLGSSVPWIITAVAILVLLYIVRNVVLPALRRKSAKPERKLLDLEISAAALPDLAPPRKAPMLYYRDVPVRLAALVLAPVGRAFELPALNQLDEVIDAIVPGLAGVAALHKPVIRKWPAQVSAQGFAATFFGHVKLPGKGGKGTPWCAAAGSFTLDKTRLMVGLVMRASTPTGLGQTAVDDQAQWYELLRVETKPQ